jgi:GT2 family glycosyltransferase
LQAYAEAIQAGPPCDAFEGSTVADRERMRLDEEAPLNSEGGYLWSCNMAIRRSTFESLGGFCESFPYATMEDADLRLRLVASGHRFAFVRSAVVCHPYRAAKSFGFLVKSGRSYLHLIERHPHLLLSTGLRACFVMLARRSRLLLRDARQCRFRGFGYALGSLLIGVYFETRARLRHPSRAEAPEQRIPSRP